MMCKASLAVISAALASATWWHAEGEALRIQAVLAREPPLWPAHFSVNFTERTRGLNPWSRWKENAGSLHYDYAHKRMKWVHGKGQANNWCQCAGLSSDEECQLVSDPRADAGAGAMYIVYEASCCKIGPFSRGFGPLRPDWLRLGKATLVQTRAMDNRTCSEWAHHHPGDWFMMVSDNWSEDEHGVPCYYKDSFKRWAELLGLMHDLVFHPETYNLEAESDDVFSLPRNMGCETICPNPEAWCKA